MKLSKLSKGKSGHTQIHVQLNARQCKALSNCYMHTVNNLEAESVAYAEAAKTVSWCIPQLELIAWCRAP